MDLNNSSASLVEDGAMNLVSKKSDPKSGIVLEEGGILIIGQDQDDLLSNFDPYESFCGSIADFFITNTSWDSESMVNWTTQETALNISSFVDMRNISSLVDHNVKRHRLPANENFFKAPVPFRKMFDTRFKFWEANGWCQTLGGYLAMPRSEKENYELSTEIASNPRMCKGMYSQDTVWLGITDYGHKLQWLSSFGRQKLNYTNFLESENLKNRPSNCVTLYACQYSHSLWQKLWSVTDCDQTRRAVCEFVNFPILRLRGCSSNCPFDKEYYIGSEETNPRFIGIHHSIINREADGLWHLKTMQGGSSLIIRQRSDDLSGSHEWCYASRRDQCFSLQLTSCDGDQFRCSNSDCIDVAARCDATCHCNDCSDEKDCNQLLFEDSVKETEFYSDSYSEVDVPLATRVNIQRISSVELTGFLISVHVEVIFQWFDYRRNFKNLKVRMEENNVPIDTDIWLPNYYFQGTNLSRCEAHTFSPKLLVKRTSEAEPDDFSQIKRGT